MEKEQIEIEPTTLMMILTLAMINPCNDDYDNIYEKCLYDLVGTLGVDEFMYEMNSVNVNVETIRKMLNI